VFGTLTPKISLTEVHVPWTRSERAALVATLRKDHGIAVTERGSYGRLLLAAFTLVPLAALVLVALRKVLEVVMFVGVMQGFARLAPENAALVVALGGRLGPSHGSCVVSCAGECVELRDDTPA